MHVAFFLNEDKKENHMKIIGKSNILILISISGILLSACTPTSMSPVAQVEQNQFLASPTKSNTVMKVKNQSITEYKCKNKKTVTIQPDNTKKKAINLTFAQTTHTLSSVVTKKSQKYSNIRWVWTEDFSGKWKLRDNRNKVLAENCVKK